MQSTQPPLLIVVVQSQVGIVVQLCAAATYVVVDTTATRQNTRAIFQQTDLVAPNEFQRLKLGDTGLVLTGVMNPLGEPGMER